MKKPNKYKDDIIDFIGIVVFSVIIANVSLKGCVSSLSDLAPAGRGLDYQSSDFYQSVADSRAEKVQDENIVIVPIDKLSRKDICHLVEDLALCSPRAIGIDVFFSFPMEDDDHLLEVLRKTPGVVSVMGVVPCSDNQWKVSNSYLLDSLRDSDRGIVNMNVKRRYQVVRDFVPFYHTNRGLINHFALSLANKVAPTTATRLLESFKSDSSLVMPIAFPSRDFDVIEPNEILERIDDLKDKVVLVGALKDGQDIFLTPINDEMPGIMIHAYALATILDEQYITQMPQWSLYLLGVFIGIFFVMVKRWLKGYLLEKLLMRVFQVFMMLTITYLGCVLFIEYNFVMELSVPLTLLALMLAAQEIWSDFFSIIKYLYTKMMKCLFTRLHVIILFLALITTAQAASYRIFSIEGDVQILKDNKWVVPQKHQVLSVRDQFLIGKYGRLGIVVDATHRIYYTIQSGKQNVAQIISAARKQSDRIASNMHKQLMSNSQMKESSLPIFGGVNRGSRQEEETTMQIYAAIYNYLQVQAKQSSTLVGASIVVKDDSYYFSGVNRTDAWLYANVIRLPDTPKEYPQICMEVGYTMNEPFLVIGPRQKVSWSDYTFQTDQQQHKYLFFASETPYDCQTLQILFRTFTKPEQSADKHVEVFFSLIE